MNSEDESTSGSVNQPVSTPLHLAVLRRRLEDVRDLLRNDDVVVDEKDSAGVTPFDLACRFGHLDILRALLEAGANPEQSIDTGRGRMPAVHAACADGNEQMLDILLQFGASINVKWDKRTPIFVAVVGRKVHGQYILLKPSPV
jgi:ankyrin repeat protein